MKKLILALVFGLVLFAGQAMAAFTYTYEWDSRGKVDPLGYYANATLKITCVSDGADPVAVDLADVTDLAIMAVVKGMHLYYVETVPGAGAVAPSAYTLTLTDASGLAVLSLTGLSTSAPELWLGARDVSIWPIVGSSFSFNLGDTGDAGDTNYIYLYFSR